MGLAATGFASVPGRDRAPCRAAFFQPAFALVLQFADRDVRPLQAPTRSANERAVFALVGRRLARWPDRRLLRAFADAYPEAAFAEIGSNDGEAARHLRPLSSSAVAG